MAITWGAYSGYIRIGIEPSVSGTTATINVYASVSGRYSTNYASLAITRSGSSQTITHSPVSIHLSAGGSALIYTTSANYVGSQTWTAKLSVSSLGNYPTISKVVAVSSPSVPTVSPSSLPLDGSSALTIKTNRQSSAYTHTVKYTFGGLSETIATNVGTSTTWVPDPNKLMAKIPNAKTGTGTIILNTYSGSTTVGSNNTAFTVSVPSSVVPTLGTTSLVDTGPIKPAAQISNVFYSNVSSVTASVTGSSGIESSSVASHSVNFAGTTYSKTGTTFSYTGIIPTVYGSSTAVFSVTDSRGRSSSRTTPIYIENYNLPTINTFSAVRCDSSGTEKELGTYIRLNIGATGSPTTKLTNKLSWTLQYKTTAASTWTDVSVTQPTSTTLSNTIVFGNNGINITNSYSIRVLVSDSVGTDSVEYIGSITTGTVAMSWGRDGVGLGKIWEQGALDVGGDAYISGSTDFLPAGVVVPFAGSTVPNGWLLCNGSTISAASYPALYAAIGTLYGGNSTDFRLPDLQTRVPVGKSISGTFLTLGASGGEEKHTLTVAEMPAHTHDYSKSNVKNTVKVESSDTYGRAAAVRATTDSTGGDGAHNNLQPYLVMNYIIRSI